MQKRKRKKHNLFNFETTHHAPVEDLPPHTTESLLKLPPKTFVDDWAVLTRVLVRPYTNAPRASGKVCVWCVRFSMGKSFFLLHFQIGSTRRSFAFAPHANDAVKNLHESAAARAGEWYLFLLRAKQKQKTKKRPMKQQQQQMPSSICTKICKLFSGMRPHPSAWSPGSGWLAVLPFVWIKLIKVKMSRVGLLSLLLCKPLVN